MKVIKIMLFDSVYHLRGIFFKSFLMMIIFIMMLLVDDNDERGGAQNDGD